MKAKVKPTTTKLLKELESEFVANGDRPINAEERHAARWVLAWVLERYELTRRDGK